MVKDVQKIYSTANFGTGYWCGTFDRKIPHRHTNWEFTIFTDDDSSNYIDGVKYKSPSHSVIAIPNTATHFIDCPNPNHSHTDVYISDESLMEICDTLFSRRLYDYLKSTPPAIYIFSEHECVLILEQLLSIRLHEQSEHRKRNLIRAILVYILSQFYRQIAPSSATPPKWLESFVEKLQRPSLFCLPVNQIRNYANYSKSHFNMLFKEYYGCTLSEYVNNLKLRYAKNLLEYSEKTILEISTIIGYDSLSSFIHFFKKHSGITPTKYRQEATSTKKSDLDKPND